MTFVFDVYFNTIYIEKIDLKIDWRINYKQSFVITGQLWKEYIGGIEKVCAVSVFYVVRINSLSIKLIFDILIKMTSISNNCIIISNYNSNITVKLPNIHNI